MHFSQITLLASCLAATRVMSMIVPEGLSDGNWQSVQHDDGTIVTTSLDDPALAPIVTRDVDAGYLEKRQDAFCWGYQLDHSGVDGSATSLGNWAGTGHDLCSPAASNIWVGAINEGMLVYYCIDTPGRCGNLDLEDVRYALGQMDAVCAAYEASYFKWPGSYEIVGKCRQGDNICV